MTTLQKAILADVASRTAQLFPGDGYVRIPESQFKALDRERRELREALINLRGWATANTKQPIHDLLTATDAALGYSPNTEFEDAEHSAQ